MSVDKWAYIRARCEGEPCPGDCDLCDRWDECPPGINEDGTCSADAEMCEVCWNTFGQVTRKAVFG